MRFLANLFNVIRNTNKVQEQAERYGSPDYTWTVPVTAAGASSYIWVDRQFLDSMNYSPLDWLEIVNNGAVNLTLIINDATVKPVPAGVIRTVSDGIGIRSVRVRNDDAAASTVLGAVTVILRKKRVDINSLARLFAGA